MHHQRQLPAQGAEEGLSEDTTEEDWYVPVEPILVSASGL
jgi:hypothetical protein